jgi:MFS family permease
VPVLLIAAPDWSWVVAANALLGLNQGLTWSTTVVMKVDLVGPARRGLATGLNEAAGYGAVALTALLTGWIAASAGLRPAPFLLGLAYAVLGLGLSAALVRETRGHAHAEAGGDVAARATAIRFREAFWRTTLRDPSLSAASQAGFVNNLNDGMAWGVLPLLFAGAGLGVAEIGVLAAAYPAVWAVAQIPVGAWSDRIGRKRLIVAGMLLQGAAIAAIPATSGFGPWLGAAVGLGLGTAFVYPTLLAAVADVADPAWRASAIGTYRLWRDLGFGVGAVAVGLLADRLGIGTAVALVGAVTAGAGVMVAVRMRETRRSA